MSPIHKIASVPFCLALGLIVLASREVQAQQIVQSLSLGSASGADPTVVVLGDLDGDGVLDYGVGSPHASALGADTGNVSAYSGVDGSLLFSLDGAAAGALFGTAVEGLGDIDGDGHDDFAVGAPGAGASAGAVTLHAGDDGSVLRVLSGSAAGDGFGHALGSTDDHDADGAFDLLVGAPGDDGAGSDAGLVLLISTGTGNTLLGLPGHDPGDRFGSYISTHILGPWGMDMGTTGEFGFTYGGDAPGAGHVDRHDMVTGLSTCLWDSTAPLTGLAMFPDLDQDGTRDVLAASIETGTQHGVARILSGDDGSVLLTVTTDAGTGLGAAFSVTPDLDGDGSRDLALGEPDALGGTGRVVVVSSADGRVLHRIEGPSNGVGFGASLFLVDDRNGDDRDDLVVGSSDRRATVISLHRDTTLLASGGTASLRASRTSDDVILELEDAPADAAVFVTVGTSLVVDATSGLLRTQVELVLDEFVTDASGSLDVQTPMPSALADEPLYFEAIIADPVGGTDVTEAVPADEVVA